MKDNKQTKILFCDNTLWGLVNFRGEIIRNFMEKGCAVVLVAPEKEDKQMRTGIPQGVKYIPIRMGRTGVNPLKDIRYFLRLLAIMKSEKPDFVFNYTIKPNIYGSIAARLAGCNSTAMMAGLGYSFTNAGLIARIARTLYRIGLSCSNHLLLLNEENRKTVEQTHLCSRHKIIMLKGGEGVDVKHFCAYDNAASSTTFIFIGRVLWEKGYDEFAKAARIVKTKYPETKFKVLGSLDPSYPKSVPESRIRQDEAEGVLEYIGFTNNMDEIYRQKGLVVTLPSYYGEGMNRALMEACASGKPIITTNIAGCRELVDNGVNGFIVPTKDADALATAMLNYLAMDDAAKQSFSKASRKKAETDFDVADVVRVYNGIVFGN